MGVFADSWAFSGNAQELVRTFRFLLIRSEMLIFPPTRGTTVAIRIIGMCCHGRLNIDELNTANHIINSSSRRAQCSMIGQFASNGIHQAIKIHSQTGESLDGTTDKLYEWCRSINIRRVRAHSSPKRVLWQGPCIIALNRNVVPISHMSSSIDDAPNVSRQVCLIKSYLS